MKAYVVDSAAVRSNLQILKDRAGSAVLWAVLKGDGYGLGLVQMAAFCREAGVTHFAVTEVSEVSRLRAGGFADASILMLRPTSEQDELRQLLQLVGKFFREDDGVTGSFFVIQAMDFLRLR